MNFSTTRRFSRALSLILVIAMMAAVFTGCGKKDETAEPSETNGGLNLNINESQTPSEPESTVPETTAPKINENTGVATNDLSVRSSPSNKAVVTATLYAGDRIEVSRRQTLRGVEWAYIISPTDGWIQMEYVEMDIPSETPSTQDTSTPAGTTPTTDPSGTDSTTTTTTGTKGIITVNGLNIRSESSTSGKVQGQYNKGDVVTILETKNGWGRTNKGWIKMDYVSSTTSAGNATTTPSANNTTGNGSTSVQISGIVSTGELNIRASASTDSTRVGGYVYGDRVEILEKDGNWGRTSKGWISLDYVYQDGSNIGKTVGGIITGDQLNIRSGPGTGYDSVGSYSSGDRVNVLAQFQYDGVTWGCTDKGWISMQYVYVDGTGTGNNKLATVTGDGLNIRTGPGTDYNTNGTLNQGEVVTILYQLKVGDTTWGNIDKGWISMDYVSVDSNT